MSGEAGGKSLREWADAAFGHFLRSADDGDVLDALIEQGCPRDLAEKLLMLVPLASARRLYAGRVAFSENFLTMDKAENLSAPQPLASEPVWAPIMALAGDMEKNDPMLMARVGARSCEFD